MIGAGSSRQVLNENSWAYIDLKPKVFWYGSMCSARKARPASVPCSARRTSPAVGLLEGAGDLALLLLHPLLDLPQLLDGVPVAVHRRALQPAHERGVVALALGRGDRGVERHGRGELGEVEHPVDRPVPVVHVDRVLEQDRELDQAGAVVVVLVEPDEVVLHLGAQPVAPPVEEVLRVVGQRPAHVGAELGRVLAGPAARAGCSGCRTRTPRRTGPGVAGIAAV